MTPDFAAIRERAEHYRPRIVRFLRDLIALPSPSGDEERVVGRIREEMEDLGYDRVEFDPLGNVLGYLGSGPRLVALDGHVDTVGVGNRDLWAFDPYEGFEDEACVGGRGASDQKGGVASAVWAGKIIRDLGLLPSDVTLLVTGTVQEEDCDGLCWQYLIREHGVRPEFVLSTEPTSCRIYRGHRGRMEIKVSVSGVSCHGSAPERGDNAIYKMAPILEELQGLHGRLAEHPFLGKGSLAVSEIWSSSPSRCAVADGCGISVDRRLTLGETAESALGEIRDLPAVRAARGTVEMYDYAAPSWRGVVYPTEAYFPTWLIDEDHPVTRGVVRAHRGLFSGEPVVDKWTFSTNGVAIMGRFGIPCIGFGPGHEDQAHAPNERTWKDELVAAAALYAAVPATLEDHPVPASR